ncbi:DNA mismatch endonuclease Vsr [Reichenbachiella sp.]|uniref:very short patch repair endonuclease n=1 Tax=Reichenbachiella sp. TaxID=2184521 RepID=UPI003298C947
MDIYSKKKRSEIMSKISGKETKPEIVVRKYLHSNGFRFRKNDKRLPGKPDILLPKYKTAILVHGCFWHGHECKAGKLPETRKEFWINKISSTKKRDLRNIKQLKELGWIVIVIWQCEVKTKANQEMRLPQLVKQLKSLQIMDLN